MPKETIKEYENEYKQVIGDDKKAIRQMIIVEAQMIIPREGRLHDLTSTSTTR
jgi:hypothetical protein